MLIRIIDTSRARCDEHETAALLHAARIANARLEVTGALYFAQGRFVQYLEGEAPVVTALFERIRCDPRHADCSMVDRRPISLRVFNGWSMACLSDFGSAGMLMKTLVTQGDEAYFDGALLVRFSMPWHR